LGEHFDAAVKYSTSKAAIARATKEIAKGRERTALERSILEQLETCGCVGMSTHERLKVK